MTRRRQGDDDRLFLSLRRCLGSRSIRVLRLAMLHHALWFVGDVVAPLVGAEHTGMIMHVNMRASWCKGCSQLLTSLVRLKISSN